MPLKEQIHYPDQSDFATEEEFFEACRKIRELGIVAAGVPEPDYTNFTPEPAKGAGDDYPVIPQTEVDPAYTEGQLREKLREANNEIARLKSVSPPPQVESERQESYKKGWKDGYDEAYSEGYREGYKHGLYNSDPNAGL